MNNNSIVGNVLTVQLEQITPIIHFQYKQFGATLRATEVKPKLDIFLHKKVSLNDAQEKRWLIDPEHNSAFGYRLSIDNIGEAKSWHKKHINKKYEDDKYAGIPLFFGDTGFKNNNEGKELVYYPSGINLKFFSLHKDLLEVIQKHICEFFALNNFGTRQSKGFGSYYIKRGTPLYQDASGFLGKDSKSVLKSYFTVNNPEQLFDDISLFYTSMRSGAFPFERDGRCASAMYGYLDKKLKQVWDRKVIRDIIDQEMTEDEASSFSLYRDVLGLASSTSYGQDQGTIIKTVQDLQRFKSPIFIKPVFINGKSDLFRVYVGHFNIPKEFDIIERTVTIEGKDLCVKPRGYNPARTEIYPFKQVVGNKFNLSHYVCYLFTDFKIDQYLPIVKGKSFRSNKKRLICERLKEIYRELQQKYKEY